MAEPYFLGGAHRHRWIFLVLLGTAIPDRISIVRTRRSSFRSLPINTLSSEVREVVLEARATYPPTRSQ